MATTLLLKVSVLPLATPSSKGHSSISVQDNLSTTGLQLDHINEPYYPRHHPALFVWSRALPNNCLGAPYTYVYTCAGIPRPVLNDYVQGLQDRYFSTKYAWQAVFLKLPLLIWSQVVQKNCQLLSFLCKHGPEKTFFAREFV